MSDTRTDKIKALIDKGESFCYDNFASKGDDGLPVSTDPEYNIWQIRAESVIVSVFGDDSRLHRIFKRASLVRVLGEKQDRFDVKHRDILGCLQAVLDTVDIDSGNIEKEKELFAQSKKVFIVHGHDEGLKNQMAILVGEFGLEPVVLHRKADEGFTVIEKLEKHSDVGYAFILLTPDDVGYSALEDSKKDSEREKERRARQNVIFEFGYFIGKLTRSRVCCLYKEGVVLPTDIEGIIYKKVGDDIKEIALDIQKDLQKAGYEIRIKE